MLGKGVDRIGARRDQGCREEVPNAHAVVGVEADVAVDGAGVGGCILRDGYLLVEVDALVQRYEGDHDLGRGGYRDPLFGFFASQVEARIGVDERPRPSSSGGSGAFPLATARHGPEAGDRTHTTASTASTAVTLARIVPSRTTGSPAPMVALSGRDRRRVVSYERRPGLDGPLRPAAWPHDAQREALGHQYCPHPLPLGFSSAFGWKQSRHVALRQESVSNHQPGHTEHHLAPIVSQE